MGLAVILACLPIARLSTVGRDSQNENFDIGGQVNNGERELLWEDSPCLVFVRRAQVWELGGTLFSSFNGFIEVLTELTTYRRVVGDLVQELKSRFRVIANGPHR